MTNKELIALVDELVTRVERLEAAHASESHYADAWLRRQGENASRAIANEARERAEQRLEDATAKIGFTGLNLDEIRGFVGDSGTIQKDPKNDSLWIVGYLIDGKSIPLRPGTFLARDPQRGLIYVTKPLSREAA